MNLFTKKYHGKLRKRGLCPLLLAVLLSTGPVVQLNAQPDKPLTEAITVELKNTSLKEALSIIEKKSNYKFVYNDQQLNKAKQVSFKGENIKLSEVLTALLQHSNLSYRVVGNSIVISAKEAKAQAITIKGKVTDEKGVALPGASVSVKGTAKGTITDLDGNFALPVSSNTDVLVVSFLGYFSQEVQVGSQANINVSLQPNTNQLNEVVVTALGIEREEKALGYSTTTVSGEELIEAKSNNWSDALAGKVAGLNLIKSGGGPAGSSRIILRGENDLGGQSEALIVVDGVVLGGSNRTTGTGSSAYLQSESPVDFGTSLNDINPEDIENVSVLKGPAATALYGSRGGNGAIIITTKSGKPRTKGIGVTLNSNTALESISRWPDYQYAYGQGTEGQNYYSYGSSADGSGTHNTSSAWGPKFDGQMFYQFDPVTQRAGTERTPWVPYNDNRKGFFETGKTFTNSISLDGGTEKTNFRLSYTNLHNTWIIPNTGYDRNTVALSASHKVTDKLKVSTKINYTNKNSGNLPSTGYNNQSIMYFMMFQNPNVDIDWYRNYWALGREGVLQNSPYSSYIDNPYLIVNEMLNKTNRNTITGNVQANYDFTKNLSLMVRAALDYSYEARSQQRPMDTEKYKEGMFWTQNIFSQEMNSDFLLRYRRNLGDKFEASVSVGGSRLNNMYNRDQLRANRLLYPQIYTFANSADVPLSYPYRSEFAVNSLYSLASFSYNDWIFLDLTARQDWTSTLATPTSADQTGFFYPSASLSTVLSDVLRMPTAVSFFKLRGSWAAVGSGSTTPYMTAYTYRVRTGFQSGLGNPSIIANPGLKPLRTESLEFGADIRLFQNRLGLDVAVYRNNTYDQILAVPVDRASGYNQARLNAGLVQNKGIEIQAKASPFKNRNGFNWNINGTFTANRNEVVELADSVFTFQLQRGPGGRGSVEARPGGTMGDIYGRGYLRAPDGQIIYNEQGYPVLGDEMILLGNAMPKMRASIGNTFNYKQFSFSVLFDSQFGAEAYSLTHAVLAEQGKLAKTIPGRYNGIIGNGVIPVGDGTFRPNDVVAENIARYYSAHFGRDNVEGNLFSTDFIKLREARFDYSIPANLLNKLKLQKATIGVYGRDLFIISNWPAFDPEFGTLNNGTIDAGYELGQFPATRTMGINLTLGI